MASLARPGGNVTGITSGQNELSAKRLELLKEALPTISRVAVLMAPYRGSECLGEDLLKATEAAARVVGVHLQVLRIEEPGDLERAFQAASRGQSSAVTILPNPFFNEHAARAAELALKYRLPTIGAELAMVKAGSCMQYSNYVPNVWRRAAAYVDKILRGAKPADLPVEPPTRFELIVNLKTAKALGLTIPSAVRLRADEVIQ